jgi:3-carboxy-cis,cis-muconate cycloisomerase
MSLALFEDTLFRPLFGDAVAERAFDSDRTIERYNAVELALAQACAAEGLVPPASAEAIAAVLERFAPDPADLAAGTARDGLPVPAYVGALKAAVGPGHAAFVHLGSTSQDIADTARSLALAEVNAALAGRIEALVDALDTLAARWADAPLMGRTRMQAALPVTAGDRIAAWRAPFPRHRARLDRLRPAVEALQFGGPVGTRAGWQGRADAVAARMAKALGLTEPGAAWHTARDGLAEYAAFLSLLTGSCGKIGQDVALMAQQGLGEASLPGGGSSAMPHKSNPVRAEVLVALARFNGAQAGAFHQSLVHEQERSGASWSLEWMVLPQMCAATGCALDTAAALLRSIERLGPAQ